MVNKKTTKKVLKQFTPQRANIASTGGVALELPNHSRGKAPEADRGLVNKKYVDDSSKGINQIDGGSATDTFLGVGDSLIDGGSA